MKDRLLNIYETLYQAFGPQGWWPGESPFEVAVGAILTQNTAWQNVERAIQSLKETGRFSPQGLLSLSREELAQRIRSSGYFRLKADRLRAFLTFLVDRYGGSLEKLFQEDPVALRETLLRIRGIGPETADSILLYAGGIPIFVVDAYTRRVFSRHGLIPETASYEEIQTLCMTHLPRDPDLYNEFHALIVRVGKACCKPMPRCDGCPLAPFLPPKSPLRDDSKAARLRSRWKDVIRKQDP